MNWRNAIIAALVLLPAVGFLAFGFGRNPHEVPSVLESRPAPTFAAKTLDGTNIKLEELAGRPVVLNFWATWCLPCEAEHDLLQEAAGAYGERVHFLGVVYQDDQEKVRRYLQRRGSRYRHLVDPDTRMAIDYGVAGVPETFFIDKQGILRKKHTGVLTADILRDTLDVLVAEKVAEKAP